MPSFVAVLALHCSLPASLAAEPSLPNIIFINADDLGYGDLSCYGAEKIRTPNIDRLAKEGRRFTDAHSPSAVCSPSRYGLLTGRYPFRRNFWGPISVREGLTIDPGQLTIASLLKESGYETACIGKWHLGFGDPKPDWNGELKPGPLELGFDFYYGIPSVNSGPPFVYVENHRIVGADPEDPFQLGVESVTKKMPEKSGYGSFGGGEAAHQLYVDELIGTTLKDKSVEWLKGRSGEAPFFLYLATTNIHHPFTPAPQFLGTSECGAYGDFVHELDWIVGEILDALDELEMAENTLVVFTSDNGGMLNVTGQKAWKAGHRLNGELLGFKFGAWEGGHRVPFLARWPKKIPPNTASDCLISQLDLIATLAAIVGRDLLKDEAIDSINQLPNFTGSGAEPLRENLIISPNSPKHLSVRTRKWLYIPERGPGGFQGKKPGDHLLAGAPAHVLTEQENSDIVDGAYRPNAPMAQLYDLENDPRQRNNVLPEHPEMAKKIQDLLDHYRNQIPETKPIGWINLKQ